MAASVINGAILMKNIILIAAMLFGWFLFGVAIIDYILGNILNLFPTFKSSQIMGCCIGYLMSFYQSRKWIKPWILNVIYPWWKVEDDSTARFKQTIRAPIMWLDKIGKNIRHPIYS